MKKIISLLFIAILIFSTCLPALALSGTDYMTPDYQLTVTLPDDWTVYDRMNTSDKVDTVSTDPTLAIVAYPAGTAGVQLSIYSITDEISANEYDWKQLKDNKVTPYPDNFSVPDKTARALMKSEGFTSYIKYNISQGLFIRLVGKEGDNNVVEYYSVVGGIRYILKMTSKEPFTSKLLKDFNSILVNSQIETSTITDELVNSMKEQMKTNKVHLINMYFYFSPKDVFPILGIMILLYLIIPLVFLVFRIPFTLGKSVLTHLFTCVILFTAEMFYLSANYITPTFYIVFIPVILCAVAGYYMYAPSRKREADLWEVAYQEALDNYYKSHPTEKPAEENA